MINNEKNETMNKINNTIENFPNDLLNLINYGKWELSLISLLKSEKINKKNLILIDKEWLSQWKKMSGYNYIKNAIFHYLSIIKTNKNNITEENLKLNNSWKNIKQKYKININSFRNLKPMDNKQYLFNYNNKTLINGKAKFDIISNDIFDIFKKYFDKTVNIKVGGLFSKNKLLLPFNYNDKNINNIFIDMIFINKNDIEEILFIFPNMNLNRIEKIRKEITDKSNDEYIKEIIINQNEKELDYIDENGNKFTYKAIYKSKHSIKKNTNEIKLKEEATSNDPHYNIEQNTDITVIDEDLFNIKNIDINNLTVEELESKIKEIEKKVSEIAILENDLNNKEILYLNEQKELENQKLEFRNTKQIEKTEKIPIKKLNKSLVSNENNLKEEYNKYTEQLKEIDFKSQYLFDEIQKCKEKEIILNNEYKKTKNDYKIKENELDQKINELNNKEKIIKSKDKNLVFNLNKIEYEIKNKEEELERKNEKLSQKEKELNDKENELNDLEEINKEKKKEIINKNNKIKQNVKLIKDIEEKNNEKLDNELNDEMNELEQKISQKDSKENKNNTFSISDKNDDEDNLNDNNQNNSKEDNSFKMKKMKSVQIENNFSSLAIKKIKNSVNVNYKKNSPIKDQMNKEKIERISQPTFISSKTLTSPNINDLAINNDVPLKINMKKPSLGLSKLKEMANLNAVIQCFVHLKEITEGFLNLEKENFFKEKGKYNISKAYLDLINNLFFPEKFKNLSGEYSSSAFYNILIKENKQILNKNSFYCNCKDLLDLIINGLHKELNIKKNINQLSSDSLKQYEELSEKEALYKYLEEFTKSNNSLISKYLYGLLKNKIICQKCKKINFNFKCYSYLYFNLSEIKNNLNQDKEKKNFKLMDFFEYYNNKQEYLTEEKGLYCRNCKSKTDTTIKNSIYSSHIIMPIIIDRGDDCALDKDKIDFPDELDLSKYIEYKSSSKNFYLCGVVTNLGLSNNFGKFEAFCKMEKDGPWYNYKNEKVSSCNKEDLHNKGLQYILFYHKI